MISIHLNGKPTQGGQALVLMVLAVVAVLTMAGLIIDGGNAFAQQRITQNHVDAAAEAGAVQLARRLAGVPGTNAEWDQRVRDAILERASRGGLTGVGTMQYTDLAGNPLGPVGSGTIPANASGVHVGGSREFSTYLGNVAGMSRFTAAAEATAIAGYATQSGQGGVIPVTVPILLSVCDGQSDLTFPPGGPGWPVGVRIAVPLCKNSPGNVGWIDWTPPAGGASELADAIENPNNPPITTPRWYYITQTGNINSSQVQQALEGLEGTDVLIPIFYADINDPLPGTCNTTPNPLDQLSGCPSANRGGNGSNQWYYLVTFANFHLEQAYIQGNNQRECNDPSILQAGGNGGTSCLVGKFNAPVVAANMTVGSATRPTSSVLTPLSVQLIK
ncbi:MAG TPA: pilus assembly protein TadG-related protein [Candidatus Limnocylindrales bacterium]|jgi:hypothetical protein|nr:pilus assembly protein TadG-related protein [Candidatus Limnocylindrales bacterium]